MTKLRFQDLDDSAIDWSDFKINRPQDIKFKAKKKLRPHQTAARDDVQKGFKTADRGKLIMACGTGKTFTALKIAEELVPAGGQVLFLVPSISLISQSLGEWCSQSEKPLNAFAVCSDPQAGVKKTDEEDIRTSDLALGFSAGFTAQWTSRVFTYLFYDTQFLRENYSAHTINGGVSIRF